MEHTMKTAAPQFESLEPRLLLSAAPPVVTALTGLYDGNTRASIVGRYIAGVAVTEKLGAKVTAASWSDPVTSVTFQLGSQQFVEHDPVERLELLVQRRDAHGEHAAGGHREGQIGPDLHRVRGPGPGHPGAGVGCRDGRHHHLLNVQPPYTLHAKEAVLTKSVAVPIECPVLGGKYASPT